ncbi:APC family permease [Streptomyces sp. NBC_00053]|uniref:APC family permease n=1 Tax=unclassified Streptomyces TaxID=2593676 RepID=UPI000F5BD5FF|nr:MULTISPECIES: APC family permease [unclassified Streptomyces]WSG55130.1 APC family permease [Streptomyces sp. NBC_01732]MCX5104019.1 APC family permease [Streptomyces sp. NBC_00439]MCX5164931.1 APC family permease [Streptomyces sp. NBC_00305]MCX5223455.1 APC family permease [Streptomyces sp. NBC_00264]MCX5505056.1 APC family permease [Streptomyces sp. NBC_00052]
MTETLSAPQALAPATGPTPQKLKRSIGVVGGTLLTLSCVTPASTLFVVVPDLFSSLGTYTALTIAIGSLLCIAVAFCYSELGTLIPSAGGEYAMVSTMAGRLAGWLVFVLSLLVVMIVPPVIAMGTADYLAPIVHIPASVAGAGVMVLATLAGLLDLRANAWITGIFLVLEVIAAAVVAVLGFAHSERGPSALVHGTVASSGGGSSTVTAMMVVSGLAIALFITQGFSTAVYLSEELENPRRNVARTVLATLAISTAVILVPVIAITLGAPDLAALTSGDLNTMVAAWSNSAVGTFVSLCVALAIINAGIVMVIQNSRVLFASARDKAWPGPVNNALSRLGRFGSPWVATLVVGVPGAALCFVNLDTLYGVTGVSVTAMYLLVAVAALLCRRGAHREAPAWRMPLWPAIPVLLIAVLAYILTQQETEYLLWTGGITAVATLYWAFYLRPRKETRWLVSIPEDAQS